MYNWIETTLNVSGGVSQAIAVILALAVVLLLFALFIFILKRLTGNQSTQNRNRQPRIAVMDSATIDTKRRLVLIRRDNIEHLILVGGPSDVVVEQNIVRNMPLPQARSGQHPSSGIGSSIGSGIGGPASIRSPMAPGPDIPARPDDTVAQNEPAPPPPAMQARQPSPSAPPAPDTPSPAPETRPKTPSAPPAPAPRASRDLQLRTSEGRETPAALPKTETVRTPDQASDLLRAATQNGFNRSATRTPAVDTEPASPSPAQTALVADSAPAVRPAQKTPPAPAAPQDSRPGSALKSPARPFSPRDRPSYGNHSITPPASGPAARAKTALVKPQDTDPGQAPASASKAQNGSQNGSTPEVRPQSGPVSTAPEADKDAIRMAAGAPLVSSASPASRPEPVFADKTSEKPRTDAEKTASNQTGPVLDETMDDLLYDEPNSSAANGTEAPEAVPDDASSRKQASDVKTPDQSETGAGTDAKKDSGGDAESGDKAGSNAEPDEKTSAGPVKAAPPTVTGPAAGRKTEQKSGENSGQKTAQGSALGNKNPIEEEMAKLLDELSGHQN